MSGAVDFLRLQSQLWSLLGRTSGAVPIAGRLEAVCGSIKLFDALHLLGLLRDPAPADILEVGTFLGFSACWLSQCAPEARVVSIDANIPHRRFPRPQDVAREFVRERGARVELVTARFGSGAVRRKFDFIFIDGDHAYESAISDFETALALLKPGGRIAFHDALSWPSVRLAIGELRRRHRRDGRMRVLGLLPLPFLQDGVA